MNRFCFCVLLAVSLVTGCSSSGPSQKYANVSGTVSLDGKPLTDASITFSCAGYPPTRLDIIDGNYKGQAIVGTNVVSISAMRKADKARALPAGAAAQIQGYAAMGKGNADNMDDYSKKDIIPADWGAKSAQERVIQEGDNKFDFNIKGK